MSILIDKVRISGFRGIKNAEINLSRITMFLGVNNSGKTSILRALQLALGDYSKYLTSDDFHIALDGSRSQEIIVDIRIVPSDTEDRRGRAFSEAWASEFGDIIRTEIIDGESDPYQIVIIRTVARPDPVKGGYSVDHFALDRWQSFSSWNAANAMMDNQIRAKFEALPFITVDAQRDIHQELRDRSSFVGKILSTLDYESSDMRELEAMIAKINHKAVEKSEALNKLKNHLNILNQSSETSGLTEITPFPKRVRDLAKRFSIHFGESDEYSFSMEYHGMGTRSWASILTVKAFIELKAEIYHHEDKPFFPILAIEEPESHLHPNAQRALYQHLRNNLQSQIIVTTHSPYLPAISSLFEIRMLRKAQEKVILNSLIDDLDNKQKTKLRTEVMRLRGEIFFSKTIILVEGITEEILTSGMFEIYFDCQIFEKGVNCISVNGYGNYLPFLMFALSFDIPVCIISDNDNNGDVKRNVELQIKQIERNRKLDMEEKKFFAQFLSKGNNIERELLNVLNLREEIIQALVISKTGDNQQYADAKRQKFIKMSDEELLEKMKNNKTNYPYPLLDIIKDDSDARRKIPDAIVKTFEKIQEWIV